MDADDSWSLNNSFTFSKINFINAATLAPPANIVKAEYYIDSDPGFGNAINIPFAPGTDISNLIFNPDISMIQTGLHQLHVRSMDGNGSWSLNSSFGFSKIGITNTRTLSPPSNIVKAEYYIDTDPGIGNAIHIPFTPGTDISNLIFNPDLTSVNRSSSIAYQGTRCRWQLVPE